MGNRFIGFQVGETSAYTPTSAYVQFAVIPAVGTLAWEVVNPATAKKIDLKFVRNLTVSDTSGFTVQSTQLLSISSDVAGADIAKPARAFSLQARQSTNSTKFGTVAGVDTIQVRWFLKQ